MMRTIAIGDIHGCLQELQDLLVLFDYRPDQDRLVFVGDLVDRGPDSAGVVHLVRQLEQQGSVVTVKGNHDDSAARWLLRSRRSTAAGVRPPPAGRLAEWAGLTPEDVDWLAALPVVAEVAPGWLAVHAGFEDRPMGSQKEERCMRTRWVDASTGRMTQIGPHDDLDVPPPNSVWWAERWAGPDNVVYGHSVPSLQDPRLDRNEEGHECWGIDTGACFGGRLTALCLETRQTWQVQAPRAYREYRKYNAREPTSYS